MLENLKCLKEAKGFQSRTGDAEAVRGRGVTSSPALALQLCMSVF